MPRQKNDGRGRMGGRKKGTPNKSPSLKVWVEEFINSKRKEMEDDLKELKPYERLKILTGLINYVLPKQQAISPHEAISEEYKHLEQLIKTQPKEVIDQLAQRVMEFQKLNEHGQQTITPKSD